MSNLFRKRKGKYYRIITQIALYRDVLHLHH